MPGVLTVGADVVCVHEGKVVPKPPSQTKLAIDRRFALTAPDLDAAPIAACPNSGSPGQKPCTTTLALAAGRAVKLTVDRKPVLLDTTRGATDGAPPPATFSARTINRPKLTAS
jgi:hypothetical protein